MIYVTKINRKKLIYSILEEVLKQEKQWGKEENLTPHEFLGLVTEELGELAQALNESYLPKDSITKSYLGGIENVKEEALQTIALLFRLIEKVEGEYINEGVDCK